MSADQLVELSVRLADKLEAACKPVREPGGVSESAGELIERDHAVLQVLTKWLPSFHTGMRASQWKQACQRENLCARSAWQSSVGRLLAHNLVRKAGTRYILANTDAA